MQIGSSAMLSDTADDMAINGGLTRLKWPDIVDAWYLMCITYVCRKTRMNGAWMNNALIRYISVAPVQNEYSPPKW